MSDFPLTPFRVIREYRPAKYLVERHQHPYFHLIYVASGKLLVVCQEHKVNASAGTVLLISPRSSHMIYAVEPTNSIELKFSCTGELEQVSRNLEAKSHWLWTPDKAAAACLSSIVTEAESKCPFWLEIITVRIYDLFLQLLRSLEESADLTIEENLDLGLVQVEFPQNSLDAELIRQVIAYINDHLTEKLSVGDIARQFGYNKAYFSTIFKKAVGTTPQQFIATQKINQAKNLIRKKQMALSAISDLLQFSSVSAFTNTFKRCCGITPSHYAQKIRQCTYVNLTQTPDLPMDDVRYIEPVFHENISNLI